MRRVPANLAEPLPFDALDGIKQPVRMVVLEIALNPLGAEPTLVERELLPGLEPDHLVVFDQELDPALHPAKAAMGLDHLIRLVPSGNAFCGWKIQRRPVLGDQFVGWDREGSHEY